MLHAANQVEEAIAARGVRPALVEVGREPARGVDEAARHRIHQRCEAVDRGSDLDAPRAKHATRFRERPEPGALIGRYRSNSAKVWKDSCAQWKKAGLRFSTAGEPWIEREVTWNYYYLRSALTYDRFFGEHILSQAGIYQYSMGFQGAARDPLQHALPLIFSDPAIVKETLRYTLKEARADGSIPYRYNSATASRKFSSTRARRTLWVAVSSPLSIEKSRSRMRNLRICSKGARWRLTRATAS